MVRVLVKHSADPNLTDSSGSTPLIIATKTCPSPHLTMLKLIEAGCDLNHQDILGKTALHYCCKKARTASDKKYINKTLLPALRVLDRNIKVNKSSWANTFWQ